MTLGDRLFWFFAILFFIAGTAVAVYLKEAAIAAMLAYLLGTTIEKFLNIRLPKR